MLPILNKITNTNTNTLSSLPCNVCCFRSLIFWFIAFSMNQKRNKYFSFHYTIKENLSKKVSSGADTKRSE